MNPFAKAPNVITRRDFTANSLRLGVGLSAASMAVRDLRLITSAMAAQQTVFNDYKALVCVFLSGGNDSNNWIVPTDNTTYNQYASIRDNLTMPSSSLLPLRVGPNVGDADYTDSDGHTYGFHPGCAGLQTLFGEDKLGVVFNVGTIVRPTTRAQYTSGLAAYRPPQIFSHSDQVTQWQTAIPDAPPTTGWGGRMADLLNPLANSNGSISMSVSLAGANTFEVGNLVSQYQVSTTGAVVLSGDLMTGTSARVRTLRNILALPATNLQRNAFAGVAENAIAVGDALNTNISATQMATDTPPGTWVWNTPFPNTDLGRQLKMVARLIQARGPGAFDMKRQVFFTALGGHDTHTSQVSVNGTDQPTNVNGAHYKLLAEASQCILAFQRAMEQLGVSDSVTTFTASDFSRTLPTNSQGSDHGWGAHHVVVGGAVNGGTSYGKLPIFAINGPDDTGLGRWIPKFSVEQHAATIAKWFGVTDNDVMNAMFPNLSRFSTNDLGFMKPA
jgi:uncharacterized protein (DUF1501 family)